MSSPFRSRATPSKSGVKFLKQFPKNFLRPYGPVEEAPDEDRVFRRIQNDSCEWLARPKVALSEFAETISSNMKILKNSTSSILDKAGIREFEAAFSNVNQHLPRLNTRVDQETRKEDIKAFLKFACDDDVDSIIDEAFQVGGALFLMSIQAILARTLVRNSERYATAFNPAESNANIEKFKCDKSLVALKQLLISTCVHKKEVPKETSTKRKLFALIDSEEDQPSTKRKKTVVESSDESEEPQQQRRKTIQKSTKEDDHNEEATTSLVKSPGKSEPMKDNKKKKISKRGKSPKPKTN